MNNNQSNSTNETYIVRDATGSTIAQGKDINVTIANNKNEKTSLPAEVLEIQELLERLSKSHPSQTTAQQMKIASQAIESIESDSDWKHRAVKALQSGLLETFKNNPVWTFIIGAIKEWSQIDTSKIS
ncbi:hypothetical protein [Pseudanabaena sp. 'Roaring Creek']|uniref:hypothetical protein n=1 Tax=Pseudanabaena sp. 'Roaring Creek' TaxID=1681830 RepID=UPI0006D7C405|nr:hypothetical protein [Pseudanabaena sp. 'Roaring Creek']